MPYYVYRLQPGQKPELLETFATFPEARALARQRRAELPAGSSNTIRMIFAEDQGKARMLITDPRTARTDGDD